MKTWISVIVTLTLIFFSVSVGIGQQIVTIGTGAVTGVYYPTGGAIAQIINRSSDKTHLKVLVEASQGSVENIQRCVQGGLDFGLVQSDVQYHAYQGGRNWSEKGPQKNLRSVLALYTEAVTLVAHGDRGIQTIKDLAGKKVGIGSPGSGQRGAILELLNAFKLNDKIKMVDSTPAKSLDLFEKGDMDAFFYTVGHPNQQIMDASYKSSDVTIVPIEGPQVDALLAKALFYTKSSIDMKNYPKAINSNAGFVQTVGVRTTLTTTYAVPEEAVYKVAKEIFDNLATLKQLHPALASLTPEDMLKNLSAPLHPGVIKYYREAGLLKHVQPELLKGGN